MMVVLSDSKANRDLVILRTLSQADQWVGARARRSSRAFPILQCHINPAIVPGVRGTTRLPYIRPSAVLTTHGGGFRRSFRLLLSNLCTNLHSLLQVS